LHQPGHGLGLPHVGEQFFQHPLLSIGEAEGQQGSKRLEPFTNGRRWQRWGLALAVLQAPLGQVQLQQQKFVEHQAPPAGIEILPIRGLMDTAARIGLGHQLEPLPPWLWQGIRARAQRF